ncbi:phosphotransferase enzyme family protein [Nocardiopsis metallicus]|uniref:Homoserine kinase type II n=1 Tax=Nocardiopsis metallicus TaxID=179819 RepID=A0A840WP86_9ACTN|nr:aminoglycoside phosphotransferase family protein [Nocardiopsis metallicus]MBB5494821.1 homoserine kinase type II [Nocardiopsis metallicus]
MIPEVLAALRSGYALAPVRLERIHGGQSTTNYRARCTGHDLFVKVYPRGAHLEDERHAIELTRLAGDDGVPTPRVRESLDKEVLHRSGPVAVSVWEWVQGHPELQGLTRPHQEAVGQTLGRLHRAFSRHPLSSARSPWVQEWYAPDLSAIRERAEGLLGLIRGRTRHEDFDSLAERTLTERLAMLEEVSGLLAEVPRGLTTQVLHGDYTTPNLLFNGEDLTAVIDFRPPVPYLLAWELGRIAFDPRTLALTDEWIGSAATLISAYQDTNPNVDPQDVLVCGRVILIQMLTSLYGVEQHYRSPGLLQDDLDRFWELRHQAARRLLENLEAAESMLHRLASPQGSR